MIERIKSELSYLNIARVVLLGTFADRRANYSSQVFEVESSNLSPRQKAFKKLLLNQARSSHNRFQARKNVMSEIEKVYTTVGAELLLCEVMFESLFRKGFLNTLKLSFHNNSKVGKW